ncbi:MAG TPA: glutamine--fructose-6-phosphate transaminase (isomerizing) [Fibrobacteria bacterium]|nr:glutamine--fructose-6-phosphate transaminase (isomerizing) [Fibrobacteria bacterium]
MCGIVAYSGKRDAQKILIEGLKRLEYRGYDSAGICIQNGFGLKVVRAKGKLAVLESTVSEPIKGTTGIGHTRWATHGAPSVENAHPHTSTDGRIAVVHNGIIENYAIIKEALQKEGVVFKSETDTEVIAHLVAKYYKKAGSGSLSKAVREALANLEGAFGIVVMCEDEPGILVGARRGSPLVLGVGENEHFLASDASAIVDHTQKVIYLDDNDMVELNGTYKITNQASAEVRREIQNIEFSAEQVAKGNFEHFMLKEIFEQPQTILNSLRGRLLTELGTAKLNGLNLVQQELRSIQRIIIAACGTSFYAGKVGEYIIEELAGIPVEVEYASEFRYRNPIITDKTLVFVISQSGETADTLAALREAKQKGATVLGICNVVGSSIARETDGGVYLHAGPEIGVASTKAFTSQVTVLSLIALLLGRQRRVSPDHGMRICKALSDIPGQIEEILKLNDVIREIATEFKEAHNFLYLGRGCNYPVALEGALKLKEISYIHAEGYPAAEMKHGPIALIDKNMPTVVIAPTDSLFDKVLSNMQEVKARGGRIIAITDADDAQIGRMADHIIKIPKTHPMLTALLTVVPLQLLAYHIAVMRGCDVDTPRNLAKSVTVE